LENIVCIECGRNVALDRKKAKDERRFGDNSFGHELPEGLEKENFH
jgi:hypothetical protein